LHRVSGDGRARYNREEVMGIADRCELTQECLGTVLVEFSEADGVSKGRFGEGQGVGRGYGRRGVVTGVGCDT
jgi:hypothetical protein